MSKEQNKNTKSANRLQRLVRRCWEQFCWFYYLPKSLEKFLVHDDIKPMETAPKDEEIEILVRHANYQYAGEEDKHLWQEWCLARWTDFNGGGWVWHGIYGNPIGWRLKA